MYDTQMGLDYDDSIKVKFSQGRNYGTVLLWVQEKNKFIIAVETNGIEQHVVEISDGCSEIKTTKGT